MANKPDCKCGCGEQTGGGQFRPGHDAKHKSALIKRAQDGDQTAIDELEERNWTKFLHKAQNHRVAKRVSTPGEVEEVTGDGLPKNAVRPGDMPDSQFVEVVASGRPVIVRRKIRGGTVLEETLRFRDPYHYPIKEGNTYRMVRKPNPIEPLVDGVLRLTCAETGGRRDIPIEAVVGVLNK